MNFLFLNSASRGWGGNEQSITLTARILSARHEIVFAYREEEIGSHLNFKKYQLPFLFEGDLYTIARLVGIVRKHRIDVIIPSKRKDYAIAGIVSRLCGTLNILWLGARRELQNSMVNRLVYGTLADGIIVNARQIKETLAKSGVVDERKIKVLYRGIDSTVLDRYLRHPGKEAGVPMMITAMGRLDKNKSHDLLLRGFARFLSLQPGIEARLEILGEGNERPNLERLIGELRLEGRAVLRGFCSDPYPDLGYSDVFAMTSESEGLSIALLEAMYLGNAPVSTYAGGGVIEIIDDGKNGLLFEYGDEKALASHLLKLYLEPEYRRKIADAARKSVAERYSAERVEREIVEFCKEVQASKHS
jgi:glycosyltransferase involved in cell wall biosynthesis